MLNVAIGNMIVIITQKLITIRKDEAKQIMCTDSDTIFWRWTGVCWILSCFRKLFEKFRRRDQAALKVKISKKTEKMSLLYGWVMVRSSAKATNNIRIALWCCITGKRKQLKCFFCVGSFIFYVTNNIN